MYATLNDSYQWSQLNSNNAMLTKIKEALDKGEHVTLDRIPSAMLEFKNRIKSPLSTNIIERIQRGDIELIYCPTVKIPLYLPFVLMGGGSNGVRGYVFLNNLDATADQPEGAKAEEIFLNARKLKVSLESCFISMGIREMGNSPKTRSTTIIKSGSKIYSGILSECINRRHSIKLDEVVYNSLIYIFSRYFVGTMLGCRNSTEPETMRNYCLYNCKPGADTVAMNQILSQLEETDFDNIANLINKIKSVEGLNKRLGDITVSNFLESYVNMYNAPMLLGLEVFDYFFYNVLSVVDSTYVNNYPVLKNIIGQDGRKIYSDLVVAVNNL